MTSINERLNDKKNGDIAELRKEIEILKADKNVLSRQLEEVKRLLEDARKDADRQSYRARLGVHLVHELVDMTLHVKDRDNSPRW